MGNMSYCRFTNTLQDLHDCYENMDDDKLSEEEAKSRKKLIKLCRDLAADFEHELD